MSQINIARHLAHRDEIKIYRHQQQGCFLTGYNVYKNSENNTIELSLYYFDEILFRWVRYYFDDNETTLALARESARNLLELQPLKKPACYPM